MNGYFLLLLWLLLLSRRVALANQKCVKHIKFHLVLSIGLPENNLHSHGIGIKCVSFMFHISVQLRNEKDKKKTLKI